MRRTRGRVVEITSLADLDERFATGARSLTGWQIVGLDLTGHGPQLLERSLAQSIFLGCRFADGDTDAIRRKGAVVFPEIPSTPIDPYRTRLYTAAELYDRPGYRDSVDARTYAWSLLPSSQDDLLAMSLHDHAIDVALTTWVEGRSIVGVMGAHAAERGTEVYAQAARLGYLLGQQSTVATGGGPGAMEAANLGAWMSSRSLADLDQAQNLLASVPSFSTDIGAWAQVAFEVIDTFGPGRESLGIPTWHYGHEPPNPFATSIAKYFRNAPREAILLEVCDAGIVFLPGAAGTVQEIFQDACENYYADPSSISHMVLVGRRHWTEDLPAWPLLSKLSRDREMEPYVHLVDTIDEAAEVIAHPAAR